MCPVRCRRPRRPSSRRRGGAIDHRTTRRRRRARPCRRRFRGAPRDRSSISTSISSSIRRTAERARAQRGATAATDAGAEGARRAVDDLSPILQQRVQETLEKVAWEAFSDLSEAIVKQVIERVERIAWEVIPQMAETLVREEIRKMKGEGRLSRPGARGRRPIDPSAPNRLLRRIGRAIDSPAHPPLRSPGCPLSAPGALASAARPRPRRGHRPRRSDEPGRRRPGRGGPGPHRSARPARRLWPRRSPKRSSARSIRRSRSSASPASRTAAGSKRATSCCACTDVMRRSSTAERTALNFLGRLCGDREPDAPARRLDRGPAPRSSSTRARRPPAGAPSRSTPSRSAGGVNHRHGLYDAVLVKDNHIAAAGGLDEAVRRALAADAGGRRRPGRGRVRGDGRSRRRARMPLPAARQPRPRRRSAASSRATRRASCSRRRAASMPATCAPTPRPGSRGSRWAP